MATLIPPREDKSETWMRTNILSANGQFKGSAPNSAIQIPVRWVIYLLDHRLGRAGDTN